MALLDMLSIYEFLMLLTKMSLAPNYCGSQSSHSVDHIAYALLDADRSILVDLEAMVLGSWIFLVLLQNHFLVHYFNGVA